VNIRNRLLYLLLPPLITFVAITTFFFYYQWRKEILATFKARLEAVVVTAARGISPQDTRWLFDNRQQEQAPLFIQIQQQLRSIAQAAAIESLFITTIEAVKPGEPVLLNLPVDTNNPTYMGSEHVLAHRQVYLIDVTATATNERAPGSYDFSETEEQLVYYTRRPLVTAIYTAKQGEERLISAYAPLFDENNNVIALLGADVSMLDVDQKLKRALVSLIGSALATIFLVSLSVWIAANKISRPVQKLKDAALNIAAGEYGVAIPEVAEPLEIAELANTLNTMSACLKEHIERLEQNATTRERLFGEYECALLLQRRMFDNACEQFKNARLYVQGIRSHAATQPHGVYFYTDTPSAHELVLYFCENDSLGFDGLYQLIQAPTHVAMAMHVHFNWDTSVLNYVCKHLPPPIIWSKGQVLCLTDTFGEHTFQKGDILFLTGGMLRELFLHDESFYVWLKRLFKNFDGDDFDLFTVMVEREIALLSNQHHLERDIFVVCAKLS
jgi:HAMP domain-containing protein